MDMTSNFKKTLQTLSPKKPDRHRVSIYVSKAVWEKFKKATASVGASAALEVLMEQAMEDLEKK